ncbi:type III pantothenate kinase [Mariniphaga sediminis]|jgi:type III pantothenate kinase|uniref:Type III pantothenate kinase n=1 Tax=Mariniphaga sediminis TaxID=1628158 RepID=A0A399D2T8_9BACT|nr:type III pantothenate kinase [Mariniphaga sediminis]RIH66265.1 type III pantothenate kinase [Mariniphaga sediminis]
MNLVIDIGNTRTKFSVFNHGEEMISVPVEELLPSHIEILLKEYPSIEKAIISSVKDYSPALKELLQKKLKKFIELGEHTPLPIENCYKSKETLGKDRLAGVVGAFHLYPENNVLVIDAGTAITYDLVDENRQYLGGTISPGLEMRFKALNQFTGRLPLVERNENFNKLFGQTTEEAILGGVQNGLVFETDKVIDRFKEFYKNLYVIITGGNANFFDKKLKNSFFVHFNLIAIGLNRILEYNGEI